MMIATRDEAVLARPAPGTKQYEFRIEQMPFNEHPAEHISELLARLNELGRQGWHVASVDLTDHPSYSPAAQPGVPLPILMEREVAG